MYNNAYKIHIIYIGKLKYDNYFHISTIEILML